MCPWIYVFTIGDSTSYIMVYSRTPVYTILYRTLTCFQVYNIPVLKKWRLYRNHVVYLSYNASVLKHERQCKLPTEQCSYGVRHMYWQFLLVLDIDECRQSVCGRDQACTNTIGSYRCHAKCGHGLRASHDGLTCIGKFIYNLIYSLGLSDLGTIVLGLSVWNIWSFQGTVFIFGITIPSVKVFQMTSVLITLWPWPCTWNIRRVSKRHGFS